MGRTDGIRESTVMKTRVEQLAQRSNNSIDPHQDSSLGISTAAGDTRRVERYTPRTQYNNTKTRNVRCTGGDRDSAGTGTSGVYSSHKQVEQRRHEFHRQ